MNRQFRRLTASLLMVTIVSTAHAELLGHSNPTDRERIAAHLNREDVAAELTKRGITREQARARVAALTDREAASLAGRIDSLPAGAAGDPFTLVFAALFLVVAIPVLIVVGLVKAVGALSNAAGNSSFRPAASPAAAG